MANPRYNLEQGERIVLKETSVRNGFWGSYTDELVLTNQSIIHVRFGTFGNFKGVIRYPLDSISQAIVAEADNGEK